jgi:hypothetical protein
MCLRNVRGCSVVVLVELFVNKVTSPVFPFEIFEAVCGLNPEDKSFPASISAIVKKSLTKSGQSLLVNLLQFMREVAKYEEFNKV